MVEEKIDRTLIISPHMDDEVYGCSSYLKNGGANTIVLYVTAYHSLFPDGDNVRENKALANSLNIRPLFMNPHNEQTNQLDQLGQAILIDEFEKLINQWQPKLVLIPAPSYNQDHRAVYDAALTAMRPHDKIHFVNCILLYEQPETFGALRKPEAFCPNYYRELDLGFKLKLMGIYQSQMRGHRTANHVEAIARVRGMQANMEFAEAFEVVRWVE